ncbi:hypothetical protein TNCT_269901 [Trichonephila clavata]|uniref:Uncharacterized protein n=1 Tax=Trichonephila clavata TaxID=2740835 RepID=A0A8X6M1X7_TRICU|nr:hypothetical protein TNCT_269901 [Trichonephila clavata]
MEALEQGASRITKEVENAGDYGRSKSTYFNFSSVLAAVDYRRLYFCKSLIVGERHENVLNWIENFEAQAELLLLSQVHKFIYAKRCLKGNALSELLGVNPVLTRGNN